MDVHAARVSRQSTTLYRNPEPYRDRDVLVVGPGTTGSEVAAHLAKGGAGRVRVACRTPPHLTARKILGSSINISGIGLNHLPVRVGEILAAVEGFDGPGVLLADGTRIEPEAVIAATGYVTATAWYKRGYLPMIEAWHRR